MKCLLERNIGVPKQKKCFGQELKMLKLREVYQVGNGWSMREVSINPAHIIAIREDDGNIKSLNEYRQNSGLSQAATFSRIYLNSGATSLELVVADSPSMIESKIANGNRLLKG
jgi:hypothetical protein